jgi:parvulin-like peptidyl-prolyl isomerase
MTASKEADRITIQHVLIGFAGSVPGKGITRSQAEAKVLAEDILARAKKGEDFDSLVREHTDDSPPGIYSMSNLGIPPAKGEYARNQMVPAFGDAGFPLQVGEFGMAAYDWMRSPYGGHVVKRIR